MELCGFQNLTLSILELNALTSGFYISDHTYFFPFYLILEGKDFTQLKCRSRTRRQGPFLRGGGERCLWGRAGKESYIAPERG